jgi:hypothetical protein
MEDAMTFEDSPEARDEIDRLLDPDDPVLLESDRNRRSGTLADITRIMIRSIRSMTPAEKQSVRDALNEKMDRRCEFTVEDVLFLQSIGSNLE